MTIFAAATAPGRAAVAVVRVSGPEAGAALRALAGKMPPPRQAALRTLRDPATGAAIDQALVLWFPGPRSETGEDMAEFQVHGGRAVVAAVMAALGRLPGLRPAEAGAFSRRAFANGKLDLTAAEGLADLVAAETEAQRRQALRQMGGELGRLYDGWRSELIGLMARLEAAIDFPDEDLPPHVERAVGERIAVLAAALRAHLADGRRGERLREGLLVAIVGPPNVGKSSLLNRLARREAAIVAPEPGTTRDVVEVHLDLAGLPVTVADTAGLREAASAVEGEGIRRALARAAEADLNILMRDSEQSETEPPDLGPAAGTAVLRVLNKIDRRRPPPDALGGAIVISCLTGEGIEALVEAIAGRLKAIVWEGGGPPLTRARHRVELESCLAALERAGGQGVPELRAEELRIAAVALGRITGRIDVEDILDVIFREFCIGK